MNNKKIIALLLAIILIFSVTACGKKSAQSTAPAISKEGKTIILHTNDTHGRVVGSETSVGMSALSALKTKYEAQGINVVLLDAGDTFHGTAFATLDQGESVMELMKLAGYDAMAPGNHDFNYGCDYLTQMSYKAPFPILSANMVERWSEKKVLDGYAVVQRENIKIGVFGLCTPETANKTNPLNIESVEFSDPYEAAAEAVSVLKASEVDYIVAICHMGLNESSVYTSESVAQAVAGIDLIVDGHSHTTLEEGKKVGNTLIVSAGEHMEAVGMVTLDHATRAATAELIKAGDARLEGLADAAMDAKIDEVNAKQQKILSEVLGSTPVDLNGERADVRTKETNLGNLIADAIRDVSGAQVSFINGGGIRASIPAGDITKGDILTVLPFGNYIVTKQMNGANLRAALESSVAAFPEEKGGFLQVSGVSFSFDASAASGGRVKDVMVGGEPLDLAAEYLVAINDYLAIGGDDLPMLVKAKTVNEFSTLDEALVMYINKLVAEEKEFPEVEGRIVSGDEVKALDTVKNDTGAQHTPVVPEFSETEAAAPEASKATEEPQPEESAPVVSQPENTVAETENYEYYVVDYDDNIWNIAKEQLGDANLWDELLEANKDILKDQDHIYVGQRLRLPKKAS